jgi:hypothetical protein
VELETARARIDEVFMPDGEDPQIPRAEYLELLEPIVRLTDAELRQLPIQGRKFLFYGARAFDRWNVPTPIVVEPDMLDGFRAFIGAFRRCDSGHPSLAVFAFHEQMADMFQQNATNSLDPAVADLDSLDLVQATAERLPIPVAPQLRDAALEARRQVLALCQGLREGTVRSEFSTVLPHAVVRGPFTGKGSWRGLNFSYTLTPDATYADGMTAVGNATVAAVGLTRADSGTCQANISLNGLIDYNAWSPSLAGDGGVGPGQSYSGQPFCQTLLHFLLGDLISHLQETGSPTVDPLWVLTPRDISKLSIQIMAANVTAVNILALSLGQWQVSLGPAEPKNVDVQDLQPSRYWMMCRRHARGYLTLGATREALLWLNMAVEALIDERIEALTETKPDLRDQVTGSKLLFAEAEQTLAEQFPDMARRVSWPNRQQAPSRYAQIKTLCQGIPLPINHRDASAKYSEISKNRNDLIHGRDTGLVPAESITAGLAALDWLADNFQLRATG